jgi:hypothetical protein
VINSVEHWFPLGERHPYRPFVPLQGILQRAQDRQAIALGIEDVYLQLVSQNEVKQ